MSDNLIANCSISVLFYSFDTFRFESQVELLNITAMMSGFCDKVRTHYSSVRLPCWIGKEAIVETTFCALYSTQKHFSGSPLPKRTCPYRRCNDKRLHFYSIKNRNHTIIH